MEEEKKNEQTNTTSEIEPVVIPPENPTTAEVPPEFASPALFQKEEEIKKENEIPLPEEKKSHTKTIILVGIFVIIAIVGTFSVVQILIDNKFEQITLDETETFSSDFVLNEGGPEEGDVQDSCGNPSVSVSMPTLNQVFFVGQEATFAWELCGIGSSLLDFVSIDFYSLDNTNKLGTIPLLCLTEEGNFVDGIETLVWNIPPFLESSFSSGNCVIPNLNLLEPHQYKLRVSYASGQYISESEFFSIDGSEYVYTPKTFDDFSLVPDTDFSRAPFIDSSAPEFLQEIISPSYFEAPPLFANFYRWYTIPNGPSFLIDLRDGKAYGAPETSGVISASPYSLLYISEEEFEEGEYSGLQTHRITWYLFDETTKDFEYIEKRLCQVEGQTLQKQYTSCVPEF